jgi:hypothetical protein
MKRAFFWLATMLLAGVAWCADPTLPFPEYDEPYRKYLESLAKIHGAQGERFTPLNRTYASRLDGLAKTYEAAGDDAAVAAVKAEQERMKTGAEPTKAERDAMPGLLRVQRTAYEKERIMVPVDPKLGAQADAAWLAHLQPLYGQLMNPLQTDKNARAKAIIIKREIDRLTGKATPPAVSPIFPSVAGITPPGVRPPTVTPPEVTPPPPEAGPKPSHLPPTEETRKAAAALVTKIKFTNKTEATEAVDILTGAASRDLGLLKDVKEATLVSFHDAAKKPMNHNSGEALKLRGSHAREVLLGSNSGVMLWGPYEQVEAGHHLIVYRFKFRGEIAGERGVFLDVANNGNTRSSMKPRTTSTPSNSWLEIGVPVKMSKARALEYRLWPYNNEVAIDRIYLFRLNTGTEAEDTESPAE